MSIGRSREDHIGNIYSNYIREDSAYISCSVHEMADVIDTYSMNAQPWPKRELAQYVDEHAGFIPNGYPIVLELCGGHFSRIQKQTIEQALKNYYSLKLGESSQSVRSSWKKASILMALAAVSGILLLAYWMLHGNVGLLEETLLVAFWFFLWECGDVVAFERGSVYKRRAAAAQLAEIRVEFREPASEEDGFAPGRKIIDLQEARRRVAQA